MNDAEGDYIFINDYLYYSGIQETRSFGMRTKFIEYNPKYYTVIEGTGVLENSDDALYTSFSSESSDPSIGEITKDGLRCVGIIQTNSEYFDRSSYYRDSQVGGWNFCFCEKDKAIILGLKELIYSRISLFISTDEDTANSLNLVNVDSEELDTYIYFGDDDNSSVIYRVHGTMNDYFSQNIVIVSTLGLLSLALLFIVDFIFYYDKKDIKALKESGVSLRSSLKGNFISTAIKSSLLILFMGICSCLIIAFNITISTLVVHVFLLSLLATISIIAINLVIQLFVFILRYRSNFKRGINL